MSSQGIYFRFTMPSGVPLEEHLSKFNNKKAQVFEIQRLATQGLQVERNPHNQPPVTQRSVDEDERTKTSSQGIQQAYGQGKTPSPLATFDLLSIT